MKTNSERTRLGSLLHPERPLNYRLALQFSERRLLLMVGDIILLLASAIFVLQFMQIYTQNTLDVVLQQGSWLVLLSAVWFILAIINECYNLTIMSRPFQMLLRVSFVFIGTTSIYLLLFFLFGRPFAESSLLSVQWFGHKIPRALPLFFLITAFLLISTWRRLYTLLFTGLQIHRRAMLVGESDYGQELLAQIQAATHGYDIVGTIPIEHTTAPNHAQASQGKEQGADTICHLMREYGADDIILSVQHGLEMQLLNSLLACHEKGISIKPIQLVYEELFMRVPVNHMRRDWFPIPTWSTTVAPTFFYVSKRMIDILVALAGLVVLLPLMPFIALAIFIESPGPIFYTQERLGKGGKPFRLIKFRSMIPDAEKAGQAVWASKNDSRITRIGNFLRRTRLDELPQVFNIFKGDMSVVGPRPERPEFVDQLEQQIPFYRMRLCMKPGLTGWAQINYRYGSTTEDAVVKLEYDLYYIKRKSLLLDLLIIFRTVSVVFMFKGT